ncbi:MAG: hypothetical protein HYY68_00325 [Thaumarchaeota archaeon]|nr:hypothetical protein [Nitrososphaerota archaeon]
MAAANIELVNTVRFAMKATGESYWPGPLRHKEAIIKLGAELAHEVAKVFTSDNLADLAAQFSLFWTTGGLGEMRVIQTDPLLIQGRNCYDCAGWKLVASPTSCVFKKRFIKTVFEDVLNRSVRIDEIECCRRMAQACLFSVST